MASGTGDDRHEDDSFTLNLLHFADQEAASPSDTPLTLTSGKALIPGLLFDGSPEGFGSSDIADIPL